MRAASRRMSLSRGSSLGSLLTPTLTLTPPHPNPNPNPNPSPNPNPNPTLALTLALTLTLTLTLNLALALALALTLTKAHAAGGLAGERVEPRAQLLAIPHEHVSGQAEHLQVRQPAHLGRKTRTEDWCVGCEVGLLREF